MRAALTKVPLARVQAVYLASQHSIALASTAPSARKHPRQRERRALARSDPLPSARSVFTLNAAAMGVQEITSNEAFDAALAASPQVWQRGVVWWWARLMHASPGLRARSCSLSHARLPTHHSTCWMPASRCA